MSPIAVLGSIRDTRPFDKADVMNWEAIGAVGELLSAIVVVASVMYVAIQIRENTRVAQNEAYRDATEIWNGFFRMLADADSEVLLKALVGYKDLESREKVQFDTLMTTLLNTVEISIEVTDEDFILHDAHEVFGGYVRRFFAYEGTLEWWQEARHGNSPTVQDWVDRRFPQADPEFDYWGIRPTAMPME